MLCGETAGVNHGWRDRRLNDQTAYRRSPPVRGLASLEIRDAGYDDAPTAVHDRGDSERGR
jgi:hypothetical protein